jgi:hypothetical protein
MKDAIEVSVIFHEGQRMFAVPKQPAPVPLTDAEIEQLASKHLGVGDGERGTHYVFGEIDFARAILAAAQRQWVGLTQEERLHFLNEILDYGTGFVAPLDSVIWSIEAKLKEKNT